MIEEYGNPSEKMPLAERCKPNYEEMVLRLGVRVSISVAFRDAALAYFRGKQARGPMAELIGELVTQCAQLELELSNLVKRQEEDS